MRNRKVKQGGLQVRRPVPARGGLGGAIQGPEPGPAADGLNLAAVCGGVGFGLRPFRGFSAPTRPRPEPHRHGPRPRDEVAGQPFGRGGAFHLLHPREHLHQHGVDLDPGDVLAQAHVGAVAEGDVVEGCPGKVEPQCELFVVGQYTEDSSSEVEVRLQLWQEAASQMIVYRCSIANLLHPNRV